jgi:hypothetical protein
MTDKRSWEERSHEFEISLINSPIDFEVDFEVEETAREKADRIWRMKEKTELLPS